MPFDGVTVPFQLQVLPAEMVPHDMNRINNDGTQVIGGIVYRGDVKIGFMVYNRLQHAQGIRRVPALQSAVAASSVALDLLLEAVDSGKKSVEYSVMPMDKRS